MEEWKWIGHSLRKEGGEVVKMDFDWNPKDREEREDQEQVGGGRWIESCDGLARRGERPR